MFKKITIMGLGIDTPTTLLQAARQLLSATTEVYYKPADTGILTPIPEGVKPVTPAFNPVDGLGDNFSTLADRLVKFAPTGYLVSGDPLLDDAATPVIIAAADAAGVPVEIIHAPDILSGTLKALTLSPLGGLQLFEATVVCSYHYPPLEPHRPVLITGLYHPDLITALKTRLQIIYSPSVMVKCLTTDAIIVEHPLHQLNTAVRALYLPAQANSVGAGALLETVAHLRAPNGCPWDREQTHLSLRSSLVEETYEVLEALDAGNIAGFTEELGDLLLLVVMHAQIAAEAETFNFTSVVSTINQKLIRRHPHVFGDVLVHNSDEVLVNWEAIKAQEKVANGQVSLNPSALDGIPRGLPALLQALKISQKAVKVGFEWQTIDGVLDKLVEETRELVEATTVAEKEVELGDLLFVLVNIARKLKIDPETALSLSNARFTRRFRIVESLAAQRGLGLNALDPAAWKSLWNEAKVAAG